MSNVYKYSSEGISAISKIEVGNTDLSLALKEIDKALDITISECWSKECWSKECGKVTKDLLTLSQELHKQLLDVLNDSLPQYKKLEQYHNKFIGENDTLYKWRNEC